MKRIGIEVQRLFRKKKHGMEIVALELLNELKEIDKINEYVLFVKDDINRNCFMGSDNFEVRILKGGNYIGWEQMALSKGVKNAEVDFLHSTCNTSAIKLPVPLLLTLHDIIYLEETNFKGTAYQNFGNIYRKIIVPKVTKTAKLIITVSNYEKGKILEKLRLPEEKVKVIYNAVHDKFNNRYASEQIVAFKKKHQLPNDFILFLGNTAPKKNTPNVIKAYIQYLRSVSNGIPMVILDYEKNLLEIFLKDNKALLFMHYFIFPGFVMSDEMPLMYNAATVFLYPSLRESFGLPILESMACGAPVITSNTSSMPEIGGEAALYVDPNQVSDIAEKITSTLSDKPLLYALQQKGIERAAAFSWRKSAEDLLFIYQNF